MHAQAESGLSVLLRPGRGVSPALECGHSSSGSAVNSVASSLASEAGNPSLNQVSSAPSSPARLRNDKINLFSSAYRLDDDDDVERGEGRADASRGDTRETRDEHEEEEDDAGTEEDDEGSAYYYNNSTRKHRTTKPRAAKNYHSKSPTHHVVVPPVPPTFSFDSAVVMSNCHFCGALFPKTEDNVIFCSPGCKYVAANGL